jgi:peptide deformylase
MAEQETEVIEQPEVEEGPPPLDPEVAARRDAALAHVRQFGDPVLRAEARPVEVFDDRLREEILEEGCLSLPGVHVDVERPIYVRVRAQDATGEPFVIEASGLEARVLQHEIDHLDGVLILDRTSRDQRKEAMRTLRERLEAA